MSLSENGNGNGLIMPVSPMYGGGGNGYGSGGLGGDWGSLIVLFLIAALFGGFNGGWGGGFGGGMGGFAADGAMLYPWMNQAEVTTNGFQNLSTQNQITAVQSDLGDIQTQLCGGFADVQQTLCNGFAGVNATVNSGFANAEVSANTRQMANMQQAFNAQTAVTSAISGLSSQFADCCCENRLANCQTQNIIQNEGNATRFADANNTRDLITNQTANTQAILDKLCQLELDGKNDKIADLERQLTMANLAASQTAQNAFITKGFNDEVDALYNRLNNCPVPTTPVYGRTPIFTCNNNGCGCGCGNGSF
jgi:hypothetical protein